MAAKETGQGKKRGLAATDQPPRKKAAWTSLEESERILEGDLVILHGSMTQIFPLIVDSKAQDFTCKYGSFSHNDIIDAKWGDKVKDLKSNGLNNKVDLLGN